MTHRKILSVAAALLCPLQAVAQDARPTRHVLVISGGISLGSYQAGATWALLRALREDRAHGERVELPVLTGASAGNINAFLGAMLFCADYEADRPPAGAPAAGDDGLATNLLFDVWMDVGIDGLVPDRTTDGEYRYGPEDGLVTRSAFARVFARFDRELNRPIYPPQCLARLGITLTATTPDVLIYRPAENGGLESVSIAGALRRSPKRLEAIQAQTPFVPPSSTSGIRIETLRLVAPLVLATPFETGALSGLELSSLALPHRSDVPLRWDAKREGPRSGDSFIAPSQAATHGPECPETVSARACEALRLIEASSAFPVAFAPIELERCKEAPGRGDPRCPEGTVLTRERFYDGGFFDNIPLGLAIDLVDHQQLADGGRLVYHYVNSDLERRAKPDFDGKPTASGVSFLASFVGTFITEARSYELQGLSRFRLDKLGLLPDGKPLPGSPYTFDVVDRSFPVVGNYLVSFGAFSHRDFRVFDYLVGVYDGIADLAIQGPERQELRNPSDQTSWDAREHSLDAVEVKLLGSTSRACAGARLECAVIASLRREECLGLASTVAGLGSGACGAPIVPSSALLDHPAPPLTEHPRQVWNVFETLRALRDTRRRLQEAGDAEGLSRYRSRYEGALGYWGFLDVVANGGRLERVEPLVTEGPPAGTPPLVPSEARREGEVTARASSREADLDEWSSLHGAHALRRLIAIEQLDRRALAEDTSDPCAWNGGPCWKDLFPERASWVFERTRLELSQPGPTEFDWSTQASWRRAPQGQPGFGLGARLGAGFRAGVWERALSSDAPGDRHPWVLRAAVSLETGHPVLSRVDLGGAYWLARDQRTLSDGSPAAELGLDLLDGLFPLRAGLFFPAPGAAAPSITFTVGIGRLSSALGWFFRARESKAASMSWTLQGLAATAELLGVSAFEPSPGWWVLLPPTAGRVTAGHDPSKVIAAFTPSHWGWDALGRTALVGKDLVGYRGEQGASVILTTRFRRSYGPEGEQPTRARYNEWGVGPVFSYDPVGIFLGDVSLGLLAWGTQIPHVGWRASGGAEVAVQLAANTVRLSAGLPHLSRAIGLDTFPEPAWTTSSAPAGFDQRLKLFDEAYVAIGLSDFEATGAWFVRWVLNPLRGSLEDRGDQP